MNDLVPRPASSPGDAPIVSLTTRIEVVVVGASTGGPDALTQLLSQLPDDLRVPVVVVQHMPPTFTRLLAERLSRVTGFAVTEAEDGRRLRPGEVVLAPGDHHVALHQRGATVTTQVAQGPPENSCRPSVDVLFRSAARLYGPGTLAVVLTGMGRDGWSGCGAVRAAGGQVVVQDEDTSVVWGMPRVVSDAGLADAVLPLEDIAGAIVERATRARRPSPAAHRCGEVDA